MIDTCSVLRHDDSPVSEATTNWTTILKSPIVEWALATGTMDDAETRVIQVYLGTSAQTSVSRELSRLLTQIHVVALASYLKQIGFCVTGTAAIEERSRDGSVNPLSLTLVETSYGINESVPQQGLIFIESLAGKRIVLKLAVDPFRTYAGTVVTAIDADGHGDEFLKGWRDYSVANAYLRGKSFYASGELIKIDPTLRLEDVFMEPDTRSRVERLILSFPEQAVRFRRRGLSAKRGIILEGPPGTGKSILCRTLCNHLPGTFLWLSSRLCEESSNIAEAWRLARLLSPCTIFVEDIELFAESRESLSSGSVLGELMNQMDGVEQNEGILTIATTNHVEVIENAVRNRPGRFDHSIHLGPLDAASRRRLMHRYLHKEHVDQGVLDRLARETEGYTGAQLVDLIKSVVERATEDPGGNDSARLHMTLGMVDEVLGEYVQRNKRNPAGFLAEQEYVHVGTADRMESSARIDTASPFDRRSSPK